MRRTLLSLLVALFAAFTSLQAETKIMPLGDSITWDWYYGDGRSDAYRHSYRNHLWYKLQAGGYDVDFVGTRINGQAVTPAFDGNNEGYTGYTIPQIKGLVYDRLQKTAPDIILLHIGTNDSMYSSPNTAANSSLTALLDEIDRYETNYDHPVTVILARIIPLPKAGSWVASFNDYLDSMAATRIANGDNLIVVNMERSDIPLIDGIHPTNSGYQIMAGIWYNALKETIKDDTSVLISVYHMMILN